MILSSLSLTSNEFCYFARRIPLWVSVFSASDFRGAIPLAIHEAAPLVPTCLVEVCSVKASLMHSIYRNLWSDLGHTLVTLRSGFWLNWGELLFPAFPFCLRSYRDRHRQVFKPPARRREFALRKRSELHPQGRAESPAPNIVDFIRIDAGHT